MGASEAASITSVCKNGTIAKLAMPQIQDRDGGGPWPMHHAREQHEHRGENREAAKQRPLDRPIGQPAAQRIPLIRPMR